MLLQFRFNRRYEDLTVQLKTSVLMEFPFCKYNQFLAKLLVLPNDRFTVYLI